MLFLWLGDWLGPKGSSCSQKGSGYGPLCFGSGGGIWPSPEYVDRVWGDMFDVKLFWNEIFFYLFRLCLIIFFNF